MNKTAGQIILFTLILSCSAYHKAEKRFYKDSRLVRDQKVVLQASSRERKMSYYILALREHSLFDFKVDLSYTAGTYKIINDTLTLDVLKKDSVLNYDSGLINLKDSTLRLFRNNKKDTLHLSLRRSR